jgi:hypothetical protein
MKKIDELNEMLQDAIAAHSKLEKIVEERQDSLREAVEQEVEADDLVQNMKEQIRIWRELND